METKATSSSSSVATKIRNASKILKEQGKLPTGRKIFREKNDADSVSARNRGNDFFLRHHDYVTALEHYNESICLAPSNSESLAIGYANRSAVYLKAGFYKYCLENIELALDGRYPDRMRPKLEDRKRECEKFLEQGWIDSLDRYQKGKIPLKLSYPESRTHKGMIEGIEFAQNDTYGRFIRAKQDLYPGDIVIIEKPFFQCVEDDGEYSHCGNCFKSHHLNLIPCETCTRAMYCSPACRQTAYERFHKYECKIIDGIYSLFGFPRNVILGVRSTLYAFTMCEDPEDLRALTEDPGNDLEWDNLTEESQFRRIFHLNTHEESRERIEKRSYMEKMATAWYLLEQYSELPELLKTDAMKTFFLEIMYRMGLVSKINSHSLANVEDEVGAIPKDQCAGLYPLSCLFNHSCAANVKRLTDGSTIAFMVKRCIKKGQQLFDCYGYHHAVMDSDSRRWQLQNEYHFLCECEACDKNYPQMDEFPRNRKFDEQYVRAIDRLEAFDAHFAKEHIGKCKKMLKAKDEKYLTFEWFGWQDNLIDCHKVLMMQTPLEMQLKPLM